jgi:hypothetical protein
VGGGTNMFFSSSLSTFVILFVILRVRMYKASVMMADPWLMEVASRNISSQVKNKQFTLFSVISSGKGF